MNWIFPLWLFGISATTHAILLAGIFITVGVFETAILVLDYFDGLGRANGGNTNYKGWHVKCRVNAYKPNHPIR